MCVQFENFIDNYCVFCDNVEGQLFLIGVKILIFKNYLIILHLQMGWPNEIQIGPPQSSFFFF